MKRKVFIVFGILLAVAAVSAGSIVAYDHFVPRRDHWGETRLTVERPAIEPATARRGVAAEGTAPRNPGIAQGTSQGIEAGLRGGAVLPLAQALDIATKQVPGEVIKVELEREHGQTIYEVKVLSGNGRVREIKLDAFNGTVLKIEDD